MEEQAIDKYDAELSEFKRKSHQDPSPLPSDDSPNRPSPSASSKTHGGSKEGRGSNDSDGSGGEARRVRFVVDKAKNGFEGFAGKVGYGPISQVPILPHTVNQGPDRLKPGKAGSA